LSERGFTLIELLIACGLLLVVTSAVVTITVPLRDGVERSLGVADLTGGSRVVLERLAAEVREATSAAAIGGGRMLLDRVFPAIAPLSDVDSGVSGSPNRAIRITRIPWLASQGSLRVPVAAGSTVLQLETAAACSAIGFACGLSAGTSALLHDQSQALLVTVQSVANGGIVLLSAPLTLAFPAGAVIAAASTTVYGVRPEPDGSFKLVRATLASEQPLLQSIVDFEVTVAGDDAIRVRQVDFRLRVEAASASLRGPAGRLFRRAGTSTQIRRWVPDVELRMSIATRSALQ
jgi:prepilin-type N-terminal cleavage/methylation domain-containing protein